MEKLKNLSVKEQGVLMNRLAKAMRTHRRFIEIINVESYGQIMQFTVKQKNEHNKRLLRFRGDKLIYNAVIL